MKNNNEKNEIKSPCILFMDYNGWWAPLTSLYYSTSSNVLVSRHPESVIEEITSYYCPQCLDPYSEADVQLYRNKCPSCFECPLCDCPLSVVALDSKNSCFQCKMCCWRSDGCNITGSDEHEVGALVLEKERDELVIEAFQALYSSYVTTDATSKFEIDPLKNQPRYTWDDLHSKLENENKSILIDPRNDSGLYTYMKAANLFNQSIVRGSGGDEDGDEDEETILKTSSLSSLSSLKHRVNRVNHGQSPLIDIFLPKRVKLRTKRMVRCRKDVNDNKMSILIQPKSFPLEGDSSHSAHKGKWWTKDSSAIHEIPLVTILGIKNLYWSKLQNGELAFLHLAISNYKDNDILISLDHSTLENCISKIHTLDVDVDVGVGVESITIEPHPPFSSSSSYSPSPLIIKTESTMNILNQTQLSAYEDEHLRDEVEDRNLPEYAIEINDSEDLQWGVSIQHNVAKVCVPLKYSSSNQLETGSERKYGEIFFKLCCEDVSIEKDDGNNKANDKIIETFFRIVLPISD